MNNEFRLKRKQFLDKVFPILMDYLYLNIRDKNGEKDIVGCWKDRALYLGATYLNSESIDTIYGQMLFLEIELEELKESKKQEKNEEELNRIDSKIKEKEESFTIREEYLREKIDHEFKKWCDERRKRINIEFLEDQKQQCINRIDELQESIKSYNAILDKLAEDWNYYATSIRGDDITREENSITDDIRISNKEIENEIEKLNLIKKEAVYLGVQI